MYYTIIISYTILSLLLFLILSSSVLLLLPNTSLLPSHPLPNIPLLWSISSSSPNLPFLLFSPLPLQSSHSFYTCRHLDILIYIPAVSNLSKQLSMNIKRNTHLSIQSIRVGIWISLFIFHKNLTPHKLTEWMVEVWCVEVYRVGFDLVFGSGWCYVLVLTSYTYIILYYYILYTIIYYTYYLYYTLLFFRSIFLSSPPLPHPFQSIFCSSIQSFPSPLNPSIILYVSILTYAYLYCTILFPSSSPLFFQSFSSSFSSSPSQSSISPQFILYVSVLT